MAPAQSDVFMKSVFSPDPPHLSQDCEHFADKHFYGIVFLFYLQIISATLHFKKTSFQYI